MNIDARIVDHIREVQNAGFELMLDGPTALRVRGLTETGERTEPGIDSRDVTLRFRPEDYEPLSDLLRTLLAKPEVHRNAVDVTPSARTEHDGRLNDLLRTLLPPPNVHNMTIAAQPAFTPEDYERFGDILRALLTVPSPHHMTTAAEPTFMPEDYKPLSDLLRTFLAVPNGAHMPVGVRRPDDLWQYDEYRMPESSETERDGHHVFDLFTRLTLAVDEYQSITVAQSHEPVRTNIHYNSGPPKYGIGPWGSWDELQMRADLIELVPGLIMPVVAVRDAVTFVQAMLTMRSAETILKLAPRTVD